MASTSEITFGSRLHNAEKILTHLQSFTGYEPPAPDQSVINLQRIITGIKAQNANAARSIQAYSAAVDTRQKLFLKNSDSLIKLMSPISSAVRALFGKASKEASGIAALVTKIRGANVKKSPAAPDSEFVSQSERSFGSITQSFANLVATLENYGAAYKPANDNIKPAALNTKLTQLTDVNIAVTVAYGALKQSRDDRASAYKTLAALVQGIKDAVKSQYGITATEYVLIKGIKV